VGEKSKLLSNLMAKLENLKVPTSPGSKRPPKSKEITQPSAHGPKGTGTAKEKGNTTPMPGEDHVHKTTMAMGKDQS
jgi:inosine-uridine nucleoside N-ribohydrolase